MAEEKKDNDEGEQISFFKMLKGEVVDSFKGMFEVSKDAIKKANEKIHETPLGGTIDKVIDKSKTTLKKTGELMDKIEQTATSTVNKAVDISKNVSEKTSEIADKTTKKTTGFVSNTKKKIDDVPKDAVEKIDKIDKKIQDKKGKAMQGNKIVEKKVKSIAKKK